MAEATLLSRIRELEERIAALEGGYAPAPDGVYNVRAFGAEGDGVTDDTAAIQATLNAAKAAGGGRVYLPTGTYLVDGLSLADADYITIMGDGPGRTILRMIDGVASAPVLKFIRCNHLTVTDLEIDGDKANQTSKYIRGLQWLADDAASGGVLCEHGTFERLYIHDTTDQGLIVAGGRWAKIHAVHTERCGSTGNIGAGIHISHASPDTSLLSCDVQISDCSDDGSGLDEGDEGAGLQMQVGTSRITVTNYISRNAKKYGVKCQAHKVELNNIQVYEPGVAGIALQYNDVRASNLRIEKTTAGSAGAIGIGAPQQDADPRDISMDLSNIHIVGQGFYTGLEISGTKSATNPVRHVHVSGVNVQSIGADPITCGLRVMGNVQGCSIAHAHVRDCTTNIAMVNALIDSTNYSPTKMILTDVHSEEILGAGGASTYGWNLGYGSGLLIGCTSERMEGSSRILWQNLGNNWAMAAAARCAMNITPAATQPSRTISGDALSVGVAGYIEVRAESGTTDALTDIAGGVAGQWLILKAYGSHVLTVKHNAAKLILPGGTDYTLSGDKRLLLYCLAAGKWTVFNA